MSDENKKFQWTGRGIIADSRELQTKIDKKTFGYSLKVATLGATFEVQTKDPNLVKGLAVGIEVECKGDFELYQNNLRMIVREIRDVALTTPVRKAG